VLAKFSLCDRSTPFIVACGILGGVAFSASPSVRNKWRCSKEHWNLPGSPKWIGSRFRRGQDRGRRVFSISPSGATLAGYNHVHGSCDLKVLTIAVDFYLSLGYERHGGQSYAVGEVRLSIDIEILFVISFHAQFTFRKEIEDLRISATQSQYPGQWTQFSAGPYWN